MANIGQAYLVVADINIITDGAWNNLSQMGWIVWVAQGVGSHHKTSRARAITTSSPLQMEALACFHAESDNALKIVHWSGRAKILSLKLANSGQKKAGFSGQKWDG